ncbi:MAG TPA: amidohydrolase, partial [Sphingobacterium sp.]|nr:amidohydrolase [Sphingobacterium sp.]
MASTKEKVLALAHQYFEDTVSNRRHLHQNPELSFEEYNTSAFVKKQLDELGIPYEAKADTGIVALIKGDLPSDEVIALRADMDALPIQ